MPKIPANVKNAAFYLFPTKEDAEKGINFGGTGFIVTIPSRMHAKYGRGFVYAVTNWHVSVQGSPVIRLNTKSGLPDFIDAGPEDWFFDGQHDIAVLPINLDADRHVATPVHSRMLMSQDDAKALQIGPGDDVFMVGRFIDHDGGERNQPAFRFGNISMDPTPIKQENGVTADAYCIDLHSRSGFSGSPVFVYRTPDSDLSDRPPPTTTPNIGLTYRPVITTSQQMFLLLGIHFAQFPELWEVTSKGKLRHKESHEPLLTDGKYIKGLSGMTCVLPAWSIIDVLNMPVLRKMRAETEANRQEYYLKHGFSAHTEDTRFAAQDPRFYPLDEAGSVSEAAAPLVNDAKP